MTGLPLDLTDNFHPRAAAEPGLMASAEPGVVSTRDLSSDEPVPRREALRIPRIVIQAFCENPDMAQAIERAAMDRLMARTRVSVQMGGVSAATETYQHASTPNLVVVESHSDAARFLTELDQMADVCDAGTKVMVIGHANDIAFYRELKKRGVSEYLLAPVDPVALIASIASIYVESTSSKVGQVYAFIGAKGGVGSSTIAHNVGWTIARRFRSDVVIADLDLPFGTASLDFNLEAGQGIAEALQDASRLDVVLLDRLLAKCGDHLSLLSAPTNLGKVYDLQGAAIEPLLEVAQSSVPFIILDMPHLWTAWAKNALVAADEIIITASPDLANLRNAKNLIGVLKQARPNDPPPKLVLNQVGMSKRPEIKPADFAKALQIELTACIRFEPSIFGAAANKGQMIAEVSAKGAAPKAFGEIVDAITKRHATKGTRNGWFDLASLFGKTKRKSG